MLIEGGPALDIRGLLSIGASRPIAWGLMPLGLGADTDVVLAKVERFGIGGSWDRGARVGWLCCIMF